MLESPVDCAISKSSTLIREYFSDMLLMDGKEGICEVFSEWPGMGGICCVQLCSRDGCVYREIENISENKRTIYGELWESKLSG